jgi:E3 ubiquitin-protein ligase HERC4
MTSIAHFPYDRMFFCFQPARYLTSVSFNETFLLQILSLTEAFQPFRQHGFLAAGRRHSVFVQPDGTVLCFGDNEYGQLGLASTACPQASLPRTLDPFSSISIHNPRFQVVQAACGFRHTLLLTLMGEVYSCGDNSIGQLGIGISTSKRVSKPTLVRSMIDQPAVQVSANFSHSAVLTMAGDLYTFGEGESGRLGHGDDKDQFLPTRIRMWSSSTGNIVEDSENYSGSARVRISHVACGAVHMCAIDYSGHLYSWGSGDHGRLGMGDDLDRFTPTRVSPVAVSESAFTPVFSDTCSLIDDGMSICWGQVSCGAEHTVCVSTGGMAYTCGRGCFGQLGQGKQYTGNSSFLRRVSMPSQGEGDAVSCQQPNLDDAMDGYRSSCEVGQTKCVEKVVQAVAGSRHTMLLLSSGEVYSFGDSENGQLGLLSRNERFTPQQVKLSAASSSSAVHTCHLLAAGADHSLMLVNDGCAKDLQLFACGRGVSGRLGLGDEDDRLAPHPLVLPNRWRSLKPTEMDMKDTRLLSCASESRGGGEEGVDHFLSSDASVLASLEKPPTQLHMPSVSPPQTPINTPNALHYLPPKVAVRKDCTTAVFGGHERKVARNPHCGSLGTASLASDSNFNFKSSSKKRARLGVGLGLGRRSASHDNLHHWDERCNSRKKKLPPDLDAHLMTSTKRFRTLQVASPKPSWKVVDSRRSHCTADILKHDPQHQKTTAPWPGKDHPWLVSSPSAHQMSSQPNFESTLLRLRHTAHTSMIAAFDSWDAVSSLENSIGRRFASARYETDFFMWTSRQSSSAQAQALSSPSHNCQSRTNGQHASDGGSAGGMCPCTLEIVDSFL